ncbi:hypothetical protein FAIPA1_80178 [Frankia sp. AiPs1]
MRDRGCRVGTPGPENTGPPALSGGQNGWGGRCAEASRAGLDRSDQAITSPGSRGTERYQTRFLCPIEDIRQKARQRRPYGSAAKVTTRIWAEVF